MSSRCQWICVYKSMFFLLHVCTAFGTIHSYIIIPVSLYLCSLRGFSLTWLSVFSNVSFSVVLILFLFFSSFEWSTIVCVCAILYLEQTATPPITALYIGSFSWEQVLPSLLSKARLFLKILPSSGAFPYGTPLHSIVVFAGDLST